MAFCSVSEPILTSELINAMERPALSIVIFITAITSGVILFSLSLHSVLSVSQFSLQKLPVSGTIILLLWVVPVSKARQFISPDLFKELFYLSVDQFYNLIPSPHAKSGMVIIFSPLSILKALKL